MKELILAVLILISAASGAEPEHDPATRAADMAEMTVVTYDVPLDAALIAHTVATCEAYGLDPAIVFAMMWQESRFTAGAVGDGGKALGILQVQPRWHAERMARLGVSDLTDPYGCVVVACDYLAETLGEYGDLRTALTVYRYGEPVIRGEDYAAIVAAKAEELKK